MELIYWPRVIAATRLWIQAKLQPFFLNLGTANGAKVGLKLRLCSTVDITWLLSVGREMHAHAQSAAMLFKTSP